MKLLRSIYFALFALYAVFVISLCEAMGLTLEVDDG